MFMTIKKKVVGDNNVDSVRHLGRVAEDSGIKLAVENMPYPRFALCSIAEDLQDLLDRVGMPDTVGYCLDIGHANLTGQLGQLTGLSGQLFNVHLHDNDAKGDRHMALGEGKDLDQALLQAGAVRMRPIFLTAGTTLLGNLVITLDPIFNGLAWAIIFGIAASTLFTLFVIPVLYSLIYANKPGYGLPSRRDNKA